MNLDPFDTGAEGPLAPADWTMSVGLDGTDDAIHYYADLYREANRVCRLSLSGGGKSEREARRLLAIKARAWIADYLARPSTGPWADLSSPA